MCGRFALPPQAAKAAFDLDAMPELPPRFNIAPAQDIAIIRAAADGRHLTLAHWGLIPAWSRDARSGYSTINARAETVDTQPSFRAPFRHHRCIIPADGFYEWHEEGGIKTHGSPPFLSVFFTLLVEPRQKELDIHNKNKWLTFTAQYLL